jgi:malate dehydrogenase (oxaloacetate-decarboxylating)
MNILPAAPLGTTDQMSPTRAAVPTEHTNPYGFQGTLRAALRDADVFIGVSGPDILTRDDIATMADGAVVFALANPAPEVDPAAAREHAAIVATGRSDFPNQINNVLAFPGVLRGLLDAGTSEITDECLSPQSARSPGVSLRKS